MMILDDIQKIKGIDQSNMLQELQTLPDQLAEAWEIANQCDLPIIEDPKTIVIAGMGGSAIGADILSSYVFDDCAIPLFVLRGYSLPKWVDGDKNLVICSSHSGNTEETLSVLKEAIERGCSALAVSRGGQLQELAIQKKIPFWRFTHNGQPRSAVGYSFGILLNLLSRLGLIPDQSLSLVSAVESVKKYITGIDVGVPVAKNLAKRIAGQAFERLAVILGAEHLEPIARRWKTQINELAKGWAQFEFLPEADHNTLAGLEYPKAVLQKVYALFLFSNNYHTRNNKRFNLTFEQFMVAGLCTDKVNIDDHDRLAEIWKMLILGDFITYYLSIMYQVDPTPIEALEEFKKAMRS